MGKAFLILALSLFSHHVAFGNTHELFIAEVYGPVRTEEGQSHKIGDYYLVRFHDRNGIDQGLWVVHLSKGVSFKVSEASAGKILEPFGNVYETTLDARLFGELTNSIQTEILSILENASELSDEVLAARGAFSLSKSKNVYLWTQDIYEGTHDLRIRVWDWKAETMETHKAKRERLQDLAFLHDARVEGFPVDWKVSEAFFYRMTSALDGENIVGMIFRGSERIETAPGLDLVYMVPKFKDFLLLTELDGRYSVRKIESHKGASLPHNVLSIVAGSKDSKLSAGGCSDALR